MDDKNKIESVLYVYLDKSILVNEDGIEYQYIEGRPSDEAKKRLEEIKKRLTDGYLENIIEECKDTGIIIENISEEQSIVIESLVNSITSEVGRAIVGLTILQLTIKSILPTQSIRLHKGSSGADFSWKEGMPMRVLDKNYITPILRKHHLLRLNADGFMMTRSLAENYPYSKLYKAAIRGARHEWLQITDDVETGKLDPLNALKKLIILLNKKSETFIQLSDELLLKLDTFLKKNPSFSVCYSVIINLIDNSTYSARLFEIAMHALFQVFEENKCLGGFLKPLSQMRSANKKHGNIGDIEITLSQNGLDIIESWDAKYGKSYLRDELEELNDKLISHPQVNIVGFVIDKTPNLKEEITKRIDELQLLNKTEIHVMKFDVWIDFQINRYNQDRDIIGRKWLIAITESICQRRRDVAPIDEPTLQWVESLLIDLK